jgi:hypothetical protein
MKKIYTSLILAINNSKMRGIMPHSGPGFTPNSLISPSIVCVFPLPVCKRLKAEAYGYSYMISTTKTKVIRIYLPIRKYAAVVSSHTVLDHW